jgi:hypothetical protein
MTQYPFSFGKYFKGERQAFANPTARRKPWVLRWSTQTCRALTIVFGPFGVDFVLLTEDNISTSGCTNAKYCIGDHGLLSMLLNQNVIRSKHVIK